MKYLLDTSVLLHALISRPQLNQKCIRLIEDTASELYLSSASTWEIAIKAASGKLDLPGTPREVLTRANRELLLIQLDISQNHALAAGELPPHHRDPFDRMLVAQARTEGMTVLTTDPAIAKYEVLSIYCGK